MNDYITRQDAIKFFTELWECIGTIGDREEWEDVCVTTVNEIKSAQQEPAIPISWLMEEIKRLEKCDGFAKLDAVQLRVLIKRWESEQNDTE